MWEGWGWAAERWIVGGVGAGVGRGVRWNAGALGVTAVAGIAIAAVIIISSRRGSLKSSWTRRKRKLALSREQWYDLFTLDGTLCVGGIKFFKKVRSRGIDPSIRSEVWPFLLGVYNLSSSKVERDAARERHWKEYMNLRSRCQLLLNKNSIDQVELVHKADEEFRVEETPKFSPGLDDALNENPSHSAEEASSEKVNTEVPLCCESSSISSSNNVFKEEESGVTEVDTPRSELKYADSESRNEDGLATVQSSSLEGNIENNTRHVGANPRECEESKTMRTSEDFATWQRIIRLDAIRANAEWTKYPPAKEQAKVSKCEAFKSAAAVGLNDYDHLEPCRIYHAAHLVAVLEAYALHDPEIGYCQGMSDLLSPILSVVKDDAEAFWCFLGFMKKARHNFRLDEEGIRRQLSVVAKIIRFKDIHLYKHLETLEAADCFFVYRMVVVMFRRELTFEQTLCLWEVIWADQAAIGAGIRKSEWGLIRSQAPPSEDLLLYAIAACVLQKRKLIIEKYSSMDEILRECNNMAGQLDVWKLLDDAHDLVATLHDKI